MEPTIKSPLPGTFYRRPNPQADPYVGGFHDGYQQDAMYARR